MPELLLGPEMLKVFELVRKGCILEVYRTEKIEYEDDDGTWFREPPKIHMEIKRYSFTVEEVEVYG